MNKKTIRILGFLVILTIYITVLVALAPVLPVVFLGALVAWLIIRRPISNPKRIDTDIKDFSDKAGKIARKLIYMLVQTLTDGP